MHNFQRLKKALIDHFTSKVLKAAIFGVTSVDDSFHKKYPDVGSFCHEAIDNRLLEGIIDIFYSDEKLSVVYYIQEMDPERIMLQLEMFGLRVTLKEEKSVRGIFLKE